MATGPTPLTAYFNENDPFAAAWLRNLITEGLIAPGDVDERSIADVRAVDLIGYTQCHFFAGIGGWSYALRLAGWPDERAVWTGSCPCQPFSAAGKQRGNADDRHLWPEFHRLIAQCRPPVVFGEQVASRLGRGWLAGVRADLEALEYGVGAADLCAASVGAPHIRQRVYWVADAERNPRDTRRLADEPTEGAGAPSAGPRVEPGRCGVSDGMAHSSSEGLARRTQQPARQERETAERSSDDGRAGDAGGARSGRDAGEVFGAKGGAERRVRSELDELVASGSGMADTLSAGRPERGTGAGLGPSPWSGSVFVNCADGKARRVEPGVQPLAHGIPNRVGTLRGAGNAIIPQVAAEFIMACAL